MFSKLVRLGRDATLRFTANQKAVSSLACVYDIGYGNNKKSQWIEVSLWGKQAEALTQYLTKGKQIVIYADDVELEEFQKNDGSTGSKLKARAINIDLTSGGQQQAPQQQGYQNQQNPTYQQAQQAPRQQAPQQPPQFGGPNPVKPLQSDVDFDDIPFAPIGLQYKALLNCM